ncbi:uncharacterized protein AB675_4398 [Cyphellophora attinorum]|uniref:Uncharacterized protein n=1 Tax=Cyphellophora attinorum TaxID=1664694 RepID=A0A0N1H4X0_9EURO|nr:uncharacterized protein AB675_4398 [Phialophora attinorum]KPI36563.1 hypothetical protein AB675_4398 [Phialophora attinorum]
MSSVRLPPGYGYSLESTSSPHLVTVPSSIDLYLDHPNVRIRKRGHSHDRTSLRRVFKKTQVFYERDVLRAIAIQTGSQPEHIPTPQLHYLSFDEVLQELRYKGIEVDNDDVEDVATAGEEEEVVQADQPTMSSKLEQEVRALPNASESVSRKVEDFYDFEEKHFHDEMKRRHSFG